MRHIDISITPPADWVAKADTLTKQILSLGNGNEAKTLIEKNESLWKDLKEWLSEQSNGKCWYSESKDNISYLHVDHFRPKFEVKDLDGNKYEGYWWLAFNWKNYRLAGSAANVPKSSKFPVRPCSNRAVGPEDDVDDESPYLLDPLRPEGPGLLSFDNRGNVLPSQDDKWFEERAIVSIDILNLNNHAPLVRARHTMWEKCERHVNSAINLFNDVAKQVSITKKTDLINEIKVLKEMVEKGSGFSAVACVCIRSSANDFLNRAVFG